MNCCESHENCEQNCTAFLTERTHLIILLEKHQNCIQKRQVDPKHIHTWLDRCIGPMYICTYIYFILLRCSFSIFSSLSTSLSFVWFVKFVAPFLKEISWHFNFYQSLLLHENKNFAKRKKHTLKPFAYYSVNVKYIAESDLWLRKFFK